MPRVPDPHALRRDRKDDPAWTRLTPRDPAAVVPDFPLDSPTDRDLHRWRDAWSRPQANEWEEGEEHHAVALFARLMTRAEQPNAPVTVMRPLMQLREELGLSVSGLRRRWLMPDETSAPVTPATVTPISRGTSRTSSRDRWRRIPVDAAPGFTDTLTPTPPRRTPHDRHRRRPEGPRRGRG